MQHGGDDDEDEVDYRSRKRAKRTSDSGGAWRASVRQTTHGQKEIPDLKVGGQFYNKSSTEDMARLQLTGLSGKMAHKDNPHKKTLRPSESNIARELDRRGEVVALAELRWHDDEVRVNDRHMRMADQIVAQLAGDINTEQLQEAVVRRVRTPGKLQHEERARCQKLFGCLGYQHHGVLALPY